MIYINEAFNVITQVPLFSNRPNTPQLKNRYWSLWIPLVNKILFGIALLIFFGLDLYILLGEWIGFYRMNMDGMLLDTLILFYGIMIIPMLSFFYLLQV